MMAGCGKTLADVGYMISQIFGVTPAFVKACGLERFYGRA
jgi:hypothetical protein